uniref:Acyl-coenzyme A thioesterase 13-like n=1 Tax=Nicotiana tabacum TaxID=4097 RepID=A0A1S4D876_TOBAC|nr:PREDICTED: acyl-coenzyme A thioesterase 13-like [Nicotiana tabacum]
MGEESSKPNYFYTKAIISEELSEAAASFVDHIFRHVLSLDAPNFPPQHDAKDSFSEFTRGCLKIHSIHPGKISCILSVKPAISNVYQSMHGGAVGAVAERVSIACAKTVVGKDKELFLGELSMSYVSAAPSNTEVVVDGSVIRSGRNLTVVAVDFRLKDSGKLVYTSNATFYHMPVASL